MNKVWIVPNYPCLTLLPCYFRIKGFSFVEGEASSDAPSFALLLVAEGFDGVEAGGFSGREVTKNHTYCR